jgi:imidazolonepropionase-like amidohydrolase
VARIFLQGATIIDGVADAGYPGSVLVDGEVIAAVWPDGLRAGAPDAGPAEDVEVIDCQGLFVCPGFIDSHCHLIYNDAKDLYDLEIAKSIPEATLDAVTSSSRLLELGFTAVRDLGSRANIGVAVRDAINRGQIPGPRVVAAGNIITTVGGLLDGHPSHLFDGARYKYGHGTTISGPWEARDAVRQQVKDRVDWIKTEASGTGFNPMCPADRDTTSEEELIAIVDEANRKGRPVAVHAESRLGVLKAARAGVRTIEHGIFMDDEGLELMLAKNIAYSPTLALYVGLADWGADVGIPAAIVELQKSTRDRHIESVRRAHEASATIIAGSDAGVPGFPQGGALKEVQAYVELAGMSPIAALKSLTSSPARVLGLDEVTGSVRPGRDADLVIFTENPLEDIKVLDNDSARVAVLRAGRVVAGELGPATSK